MLKYGFTVMLSVIMLLAACAPARVTQEVYDWGAYDPNEHRQEKDDVIVEITPNSFGDDWSPIFYANLQACNENGILLVDSRKQPLIEKVLLPQAGQWWYEVAVTNNTEHVIRFNQVIIRLFDPAGNQYEALNKDELIAIFMSNRPCPSSVQAVGKFNLIKLHDRNQEILPHTTVTARMVFNPIEPIPGIWKLALYEVPVETDQAGKVTKTTRFEIHMTVKKFINTYERAPFGAPKLISSEEVQN